MPNENKFATDPLIRAASVGDTEKVNELLENMPPLELSASARFALACRSIDQGMNPEIPREKWLEMAREAIAEQKHNSSFWLTKDGKAAATLRYVTTLGLAPELLAAENFQTVAELRDANSIAYIFLDTPHEKLALDIMGRAHATLTDEERTERLNRLITAGAEIPLTVTEENYPSLQQAAKELSGDLRVALGEEMESQPRSPLDFANRGGNEKAAGLLKKFGANPGNEEVEKGR